MAKKGDRKVASWEDFREYLSEGIELTAKNMITIEYMVKTVSALHDGKKHQYYDAKNTDHFEQFYQDVMERWHFDEDDMLMSLARAVSSVIDEALVFAEISDEDKNAPNSKAFH